MLGVEGVLGVCMIHEPKKVYEVYLMYEVYLVYVKGALVVYQVIL